MKRFLITTCVAIVLAVIFFQQYLASQNNEQDAVPINSQTPVPLITVKDIPVTVRIAKTEDEITRGLGGSVNLPDNEGMLFLFNEKDTPRVFWMKNMLMPIDIIWLNDGKIVQIDAQVLPPDSPNVPDVALKLYPSNQPVDNVLEMNAGWAEKNNVIVGDIVDLQNLD